MRNTSTTNPPYGNDSAIEPGPSPATTRCPGALVMIMALLFAIRAGAADVTIAWIETGAPVGYGYLPHLASDGWGSFVSIYEQSTGFTPFGYQTGFQQNPDLFWNPSNFVTSPTQPSDEVGHSPAIAIAPYFVDGILSQDNIIEVHQGGQDDGAALWFRAGQMAPGQVQPTGSDVAWEAAQSYDTGFNSTVAVDQYCSSCEGGTTTIVEVHQSQSGPSPLWFHIGTFSGLGTPTPTVSFGPAMQFDPGFDGYAPSVSIADGLIVLVGQGSGGSLWFSIGVLESSDQSIGVTWTTPQTYDSGYNPSISLVGCTDCGKSRGFKAAWDLVEVHQSLNNTTGPLLYRTGRLNPPSGASYPTTIKWTPNADTQYADEGCYPAVSQMPFPPDQYYEVLETHSTACNEPADIVSAVGSLTD